MQYKVQRRSADCLGWAGPLLRGMAIASAMAWAAPTLAQQTTLANPNRTAFKCVVSKSTVYSDAPCVGAQRIDLQPTRGFSKSSGRERVGTDVQREHYREQVGDALRPLTGKSNQEMDTYARRMKLPATVRQECSSLDTGIARAEADERVTAQVQREAVQRSLFALRVRFRQLAC